MRRNRSRCLSVRFTSTAIVSLRWFCGCFAKKSQLLPFVSGVMRFGAGYAFRMPSPLALATDPVVVDPGGGIMLLGKQPFVLNTTGGPGERTVPHCDAMAD